MLLVHGLASSPLEMRYLATSLNKMGFTVSVPSLPRYGYGNSQGCGNWEEWIELVRAKFSELEGGYDTVCVAGLSMGATLALAMAVRERSITALALLSLTLRYDGWVVPWYRFLFNVAYYTPLRNVYKFHEGEPYGLKNIQLRKRVAQAMATAEFSDVGPSTLTMQALHQARLLAHYVEQHASKVKSDLLVIHAVDDETASPKVRNSRWNTSAHPSSVKSFSTTHITSSRWTTNANWLRAKPGCFFKRQFAANTPPASPRAHR